MNTVSISKHIIIVDDDEKICESFKDQLSAPTIQVSTFTSPLKAIDFIQHIESDTINLLVCDLQMPEKNGIDLVKEIRAMPGNADLKVIILTNSTDIDAIADAGELGNIIYIQKPSVDFIELLKMIREQVGENI